MQQPRLSSQASDRFLFCRGSLLLARVKAETHQQNLLVASARSSCADEAMIMLSDAQKSAAHALLASRPTVITGTRAITSQKQATAWHREVTDRMHELRVRPEDVQEFCDIAGVAD